jgi:hypothetical protein
MGKGKQEMHTEVCCIKFFEGNHYKYQEGDERVIKLHFADADSEISSTKPDASELVLQSETYIISIYK